MGLMESTWYLPEEQIHYRNYPELNALMPDIDTLLTYALKVNDALVYYNDGTYNKIDIDVIDLQKHISLCRTLSEALGKAENVCYDILVELREVQSILQNMLYVHNRFGSQYIGTPTASEASY